MGFFNNIKQRWNRTRVAKALTFSGTLEPVTYSDPKYKRSTTASRRAERQQNTKYLHVSIDCVQAARRDLGLKYNPGIPYVK